jgi:hypothetical protein
MDEAAKQRVKDALVKHARESPCALTDDVAAERHGGQLDRNTSQEVDDNSHSYEAGDLEGLLDDSEVRARETLKAVESLDFAPAERVGPGAIVAFGGNRYVAGVPSGPFDCDGIGYEGIAVDAPVYAHIEGLRVGDTFSFAGQEHHIDLLA